MRRPWNVWIRPAAALALALAAAWGSVARAQEGFAKEGEKNAVLAEGTEEIRTPMRDGVKLAANLYRPKNDTGAPAPVIIMRTPYGKDSKQFKIFTGRYKSGGYVFMLQDCRGKFRSEGKYRAFEDDYNDGFDTIEWVAKQPWCNGKVGITGASAMGITANAAAAAAPPHLLAAYVIVAPHSMFNDSSYINGVFKEADISNWMNGQGAADQLADVRSRPLMDQKWKDTDLPYRLPNVKIPMYNVGGWYDIFCEGNLKNFMFLQNQGGEGAKGKQKLKMGPFGHGQIKGELRYVGDGGLAGALIDDVKWFDYWLKGEQNGIMDEPPVRYYMMASAEKGATSPLNAWRASDTWPPKNAVDTRYYLQPDKLIKTTAPAEKGGKITYAFDPANPVKTVGGQNLTLPLGPMDQRAIEERRDYLRFATEPLTKNVVVAGKLSAELWVSTDAPDTDIHVKLVDVYPSGYEALIADSPTRLRYRHGREAGLVKMMEPGKPEKITVDMWSTANTFEVGHRIGVHVTSSNAPRFEVNPNNGEAPGKNTMPSRVANNTIHLASDMPSAIVLPVLPE